MSLAGKVDAFLHKASRARKKGRREKGTRLTFTVT